MYCSNCGKELRNDALSCEKCGCLTQRGAPAYSPKSPSVYAKGNAKKSYIASVISAIATFIIRLTIQEHWIYYENILENKEVLGIDRDLKPLFTAIPGIALIIAALVITSDKITDSQKKISIFVINAIWLLLSVLFIWFDIPSEIIDF